MDTMPPPNIYLSPKALRFLCHAIDAYCEVLEQANWHQDDESKYVLENDISYYTSLYREFSEALVKSDLSSTE